jgi:cell division protein ZapE
MNSLKKTFIEYCDKKKFEKNEDQIKIIELLNKFYKKKTLLNLFLKSDKKLGFYLHGGVGVGKTMILNFFFNYLKIKKKRSHFNEFMIDFHEFRHKNKDQSNIIEKFVKNLKIKCELLYFDEFQVTNIVDAMILGKLFEIIFKENIRVIITSNTKINDLYKEGLQREQFLPFIKVFRTYSIEKELKVNEDYRKSDPYKLERFFSLEKKDNFFKVNRIFHDLIKKKNKKIVEIQVKGRVFKIIEYYEGIAKFDFGDLCAKNIGAEDYIEIAKRCSFIFIENLPIFTNENLDQKQRFITLIDILYEKKISLMITSLKNLENISFSAQLADPFKRTISRLHELTSPN